MGLQRQHSAGYLVWAIGMLIMVGLFLPAALAAFGGAEKIAAFAAASLQRPDLQDIFLRRLDDATVLVIRIGIVGALLAGVGFLFLVKPFDPQGLLWRNARKTKVRLQREVAIWQNLALPTRIGFLLLLIFYLVTRMYMIETVPLERDESMSYYYFVKPGPLVAMTYYPYPNNHPLYSLLAWPFAHLPLPLAFKIRLPVLLLGMACLWVFFRLSRQVLQQQGLALASTVMLMSLFPFGRFSVYGRGYLLMLLLATLLVLFYRRSLQPSQNPALGIIALLQVLGLYTHPTFIYFSAISIPLFGWFLIVNRRTSWARYAWHIEGIVAAVALLYLPFIITAGGWQGFTAVVYSGYENRETWTLARSWKQGIMGWNIFLLRPREEITGWFFLATASLGIVYIFYRKRYMSALLFGMLLLWLPVVAHLLQRHYIPERAFTVSIIAFSIGMMGAVSFIHHALWRKAVAFFVAIAFAVNYCLYFLSPHYPDKGERNLDASAAIFAKALLERNATTIYLDDGWYRPVIEMYFHEAGKQISIYQNSEGSAHHREYSAADHYDAVIIRSHINKQPAAGFAQKMTAADGILYWYKK